MKWNEVFCNTFKALRQQIEPDTRKRVDFMLPSMPMVEACRADDFDFFQPLIASGKLTIEQMHHAAQRYYLGKTKSGQPIFWMIDDMFQPLDAYIGTTWLSTLLKTREPLLSSWFPQHCLFGLHLLDDNSRPIGIVESERTAVLLSELFPEFLWMFYMTPSHLEPSLFAPLEGQSVTLFPRTDSTMSNYLFSLDLADHVRRLYDLDITVDTTLEDHATDDQKSRCIDLLDFLCESP